MVDHRVFVLGGDQEVLDGSATFEVGLHIEKSKPQTKTVTYRKVNNIDIKTLGEDMGKALVVANNCSDLAALVDMYNVKLSAVLNNHASQKTKTVKISHCQPWFNAFIKEQIVLRRLKEKAFKLDPTDYNYQAFLLSVQICQQHDKTCQETILPRIY